MRIRRTENSTAVVLEGLTFQNGHSTVGSGENEDGSGGAIRIDAEAFIYSTLFLDNPTA